MNALRGKGRCGVFCSVKTVWSMPERFRGELLTMGRYTNPASFFTFIRGDRWSSIVWPLANRNGGMSECCSIAGPTVCSVLKAGMVCLQCKNCMIITQVLHCKHTITVIHTWALQGWASHDTPWTTKKRATMFSIISLTFLARCLLFYTSKNKKEYSTIYLFNDLMTS